MHHSFIHNNVRVDVALRESSGAWAWTCAFSGELIGPLTSEKNVNSVSDGLKSACQTARQTIERHRNVTKSNMTDNYLSLHVEAISTCSRKYRWVITERPTPDQPIELAASLQLYDKPSDAYRAGKSVLHGLAGEKAPQAAPTSRVHDPLSPSAGAPGALLH